jgi:hypothetical protein
MNEFTPWPQDDEDDEDEVEREDDFDDEFDDEADEDFGDLATPSDEARDACITQDRWQRWRGL